MKTLPKIILPVVCMVFAILAVLGFSASLETASNKKPNYSVIDTNEGIFAKEINPKMIADYFDQKKNNNKTIGWLAIPDVCYYPIMYSGDNEYYLNRNEKDEYAESGSIFLNADINKDLKQQISLIHGHHMYDGTGFAQLKKYKNEIFFQENKYIEIFDGEYLRLYKPFTVLLYKDGKEWLEQDIKSTEAHIEYMKSLYEKSIVPMKEGVTPDFEAKAVFFSTCDYTFLQARLIVGAYLVMSYKY